MKTLIEIDRKIWADVKHFATIKKFSLNSAVQFLLKESLNNLVQDQQILGGNKK
jgi:hypothetical protein